MTIEKQLECKAIEQGLKQLESNYNAIGMLLECDREKLEGDWKASGKRWQQDC